MTADECQRIGGHHYVPDLDGLLFCDRCGDCPAERERDRQIEAGWYDDK